jgi:delta 1-pyrroline-5-carboxylate dehydrogenase
VEQINASGYGLTLGVHTRIDETIAQVTGSANVQVAHLRAAGDLGDGLVDAGMHAEGQAVTGGVNLVGAVVGVQPFGGEGLSGTGPKAGGPLYLYRLLSSWHSACSSGRPAAHCCSACSGFSSSVFSWASSGRNMVGAVVGVQPFGGEGLSGTGPKAGGPLYLYRRCGYARRGSGRNRRR